jgi:hypothetical protein
MNKIATLLIVTAFITSLAIAQDENTKLHSSPPMPVEVLFGNNRFVSQFSINKKFAENSRFGFLATSYIAADYGNDPTENESMNVALIKYDILKGFGLVGGAALNSHWGFRPYSGFQYIYANQQFMAMMMPGFYLTESHNFESVGFVEYRPHLKNAWSLFSHLEGLYNVDMNTKKHDRSFIYGRLGLSYKTFGFGFAANCDWYGPFKESKVNTGIFLRKVFI